MVNSADGSIRLRVENVEIEGLSVGASSVSRGGWGVLVFRQLTRRAAVAPQALQVMDHERFVEIIL